MKQWLIIFLLSCVFIGCKKTIEPSKSLGLGNIDALYPLKIGNVFNYRMDSSRFVNFKYSTAYYSVKDTVVNTFIDNQGRTCYTIFRYITDTLNIQPYQYSESYYVAKDNNKIEVVDNYNRRFILLVNPVSLNVTWSGNSYLDSSQLLVSPFASNLTYANWVYQYTAINQPDTVLNHIFPNSYIVLQHADSTGFNANSYSSTLLSEEVYSASIGLVYKELYAYSYEAPPNAASYYDDKFDVKLYLISYK